MILIPYNPTIYGISMAYHHNSDWIGLRENFNRKPELFSHEDHGAFL
jgi:hypothetical protein